MNVTDNVNKALKGDQDAIGEIYYSSYPKMYAVAVSILKNETDAEDVVQDSFIKAFSSLDKLNDAQSFEPWLGKIVSNKCKDYLKKKKPILFSSQNEDDNVEPFELSIEDESMEYDPEAVLVSADTKKQIMDLLNTLPDEQRICFVYHVIQEMKISEIAEMLEIPENTVKSRINYAKSKMKAKINELEEKDVKLRGFAGFALFPFIRQLFTSTSTSVPPISTEILTGSMVGATSTTTAVSQAVASSTSAVVSTTAKTVVGKAVHNLGAKIAAGVLAAAITTTAVIGGVNLLSSESKPILNSSNDSFNENISSYEEILSDDELLNNSELFSGDVVINGKKFNFPCKLSQLKKYFTVKDEKTIAEYGLRSISFVDGLGFDFKVYGYSDKDIDEEIYCYSIIAKSNNTNISFPKGLKIGAKRSEVEEIFDGYTDPRPSYSSTRNSNYCDLLLSEDLLGLPYSQDLAVGNEFNIGYNGSVVDKISYSAKIHIEDNLYSYKEYESSEGTVYFPLPTAFAGSGSSGFAVYNYEGKDYIINCYNTSPDTWKNHNDTSERGIIDKINMDMYFEDGYSETTPTFQYNSELVKCATAFYDKKSSFEKSKVAIGEEKIVEYPTRGAVLICGFANTYVTIDFKIFAEDFSEIPQAVIDKFESIVNNAAKNLKY